jgi:hypothetical protein
MDQRSRKPIIIPPNAENLNILETHLQPEAAAQARLLCIPARNGKAASLHPRSARNHLTLTCFYAKNFLLFYSFFLLTKGRKTWERESRNGQRQ